MSQSNIEYVNNAITTLKTNKNVLEFLDKMNPANVMNFANIHANGKEKDANGRKIYSKIGIFASDFSAGKGENNVRAEANISPAEARFIFARVQSGMGRVTATVYESLKIFGPKDENGYAETVKLKIYREQSMIKTVDGDQKEVVKERPWTVSIDNGIAKKGEGHNGSAWVEGDFQSQSRVIVTLTDQEMFCHMSSVAAYIDLWEKAYGPKLIRDGRTLLDARMAEAAAEAERNPKPKPEHKAPPTQQPSSSANTGGKLMSLEEARAVKIPFGSNVGLTMGQVEAKDGAKGLDWYVTKMKVDNQNLRDAAQTIINHLKQVA